MTSAFKDQHGEMGSLPIPARKETRAVGLGRAGCGSGDGGGLGGGRIQTAASHVLREPSTVNTEKNVVKKTDCTDPVRGTQTRR